MTKWAALVDAACAVATIAAGTWEEVAAPLPAPSAGSSVNTAALLLAEQCVDDIAALMETAIAALISTIEQGRDPRGSARALLREFRAARSALSVLIPEIAATGVSGGRSELT